jgi:16S rRNA (guanine966-N2)-methyltransferase
MTRIIAGSAGGRRIRTPPGDRTRPTSDRVREALFSALESELDTLVGARLADVYAGSGAVGLEACSRGADHVTFIERAAAVSALIRTNARELGFSSVTVVCAAAGTATARPPAGPPHDVAFLDPPYSTVAEELGGVLTNMRTSGWLVQGAIVVIERAHRTGEWGWPAEFVPLRSKRYGDTVLWYGRFVSPPR